MAVQSRLIAHVLNRYLETDIKGSREWSSMEKILWEN